VQAVVGQPVDATLIAPPDTWPPGVLLGARIEVPVTREIVSAFRLATRDGATYSVELDGLVTAGDYNLVWRTDDPDPPVYETFIPLHVIAAGTGSLSWPAIDWDAVRPTVDEVAALERTRTTPSSGEDTGVFTELTRPTADEVDTLIDQAARFMAGQLPLTSPITYYDQIREFVAITAALLIETSYFREQLDEGAVEVYRDLLRGPLLTLQNAIGAETEAGAVRLV
jgi:hypothetical protein